MPEPVAQPPGQRHQRRECLGGPAVLALPTAPARARRPVRSVVRERAGTVARPVLRASLRSPVLAPAVRTLMPGRAKRLTRLPAFHPTARTHVTAEGDIVVDVAGLHTTGAALVLKQGEEELSLPLRPEGDALRARLGRAQVLAEGEWGVHVERTDDGARRRADAVIVESAELVGRAPELTSGQVVSRIPFATDRGRLAVRAWARPAHLEIGTVDTGGPALIVEGRTIGRQLCDSAVVVASRRGEDTMFESAEVVVSGDHVWFSVPHAGFAERCGAVGGDREIWDLHVLDGGARVPVGRIGGDMARRKATDLLSPGPARGGRGTTGADRPLLHRGQRPGGDGPRDHSRDGRPARRGGERTGRGELPGRGVLGPVFNLPSSPGGRRRGAWCVPGAAAQTED
ncbi:hypothetical protein [Streptomyces sp. NPDC051684]|uniref:hypothetical protein n=1 Tax=Streptomyces sp. NPDC051684 TaxID=3365670 RepID=UPI003795242C